ncbi:hypothetical protein [Litchfieldia salsa]|nr:hypothetical protein [Litchfieldia salsa]
MRKRTTRNILFMLSILLLILLIIAPFWLWQLKSETELDVLIVDKTVPDQTYREHKGLMWLLNQQKYVQSDGHNYQFKRDYVGFVPEENETYAVRPLPDQLDKYNLIYFADGYGVYEEEFQGDGNVTGTRSKQIYGGITGKEISQIRDAVYKNGTTLIAEFNTFASPTNEDVRQEFYKLLNLSWSGWIGRYFTDLNGSEVPIWVKENYENQTKEKYQFSGSGYVFVAKNDQVVILDQEDMNGTGVVFTFTDKGKEFFKEDVTVNYNYWFDVISSKSEGEVLATYSVSVNKKGNEKLKENEIPAVFPAVIHHKNPVYESFYFAGDFADEAELPSIYRTVGLTTLREWITPNSLESTLPFYYKAYIPMMSKILKNIKEPPSEIPGNKQEVYTDDDLEIIGQVGKDYLQIYKDGKWDDFLIKGVNLGMAKPGTWPGEGAITKTEYSRWFEQIGEMGANAIRVYTIHPPSFYEALLEYNLKASEPIYLFHGVWVNEEKLVKSQDSFDKEVISEFISEIKHAVDVVHGNITIPDQAGHSSGVYTSDISPYVLGWIMGIEWDPGVVESTNLKHNSESEYNGNYLYTKGASAFEQWLAMAMDETIAYETENYKVQRPMSFTNWPTTDYLEHPSEKDNNENRVGLNPNAIYQTDHYKSGLFASYHAYPYYPDFLNTESRYISYEDQQGELNNYAGYLQHLKESHRMPILIAEFGVPSSRGLTHRNVYGMDQGHHSETEQGQINAKLYQNIVDETMAGGIVFTWQDEWFKRTWNTMAYDNKNQRVYWSNAQTNEQQFGMLSFDPAESYKKMIKVDGNENDWKKNMTKKMYESEGLLSNLSVTHDERYLYLKIQYDKEKNIDNNQLNTTILVDSIDNQGQSKIPGINRVSTGGVDFIVQLDGKTDSRVLVDSYYDTFYYDYAFLQKRLKQELYVDQTNNGVFHPIRLALMKDPIDYYETGILHFGNGDPRSTHYNSLTDINFNRDTNILELRLPWALLNVKDPSQREVMGDVWSEKGLKNSKFVKGIKIGAVVTDSNNEVVQSFPQTENGIIPPSEFREYSWDTWELPTYHERLKQSYYILQELFHKIK